MYDEGVGSAVVVYKSACSRIKKINVQSVLTLPALKRTLLFTKTIKTESYLTR
jgi:hypothetical protein